MEKIKRSGWVIAGTVSVVLAALGIFLPILPTTPFLLLATFCYGRGSKRFYDWLLYRSWFSSYLRNFQSGLGIPVKLKVSTIILLWLTIVFSIAFMSLPGWLEIVMGFVAISVTIHLLRIKTFRPAS
jgi:uncharacterized membrane protein YbaN (DUF454 family)